MKENKTPISTYILLHIMLLIYAGNSICIKTASLSPTFSFRWFLFYGLTIFCLGIYAIGWQQVIKKMALTTAFANKSITIVWGMIFSALLFGDSITWKKILGATLVMVGVVLFAYADQQKEEKK